VAYLNIINLSHRFDEVDHICVRESVNVTLRYITQYTKEYIVKMCGVRMCVCMHELYSYYSSYFVMHAVYILFRNMLCY
jgi:hypothetical protein